MRLQTVSIPRSSFLTRATITNNHGVIHLWCSTYLQLKGTFFTARYLRYAVQYFMQFLAHLFTFFWFRIKVREHQADLAKQEEKREGEEILRLVQLHDLEIQRKKEKEHETKIEYRKLYHVSSRKADSSKCVFHLGCDGWTHPTNKGVYWPQGLCWQL